MDKQMKYLIGLMAMGLMLAFSAITHATPGARVLITDNPNHRVIEVDPITQDVVWQYGRTGVPGSGPGHLNYPNEAIPLTNGNIMIADTYNGRVIEVGSATRNIVWQYTPEYTTTFRPVDIKRCKDYLPQGITINTLLITDGYSPLSRVVEITYPGGNPVWDFNALNIGGTGDYIFWEAEKRPGIGTPTYLITCRSNTGEDSIIEVERTGPNSGRITWRSRQSLLNDPRDANWVSPKTALITDTDNKRVLAVDYWDGIGNIVWQWGPYSEPYLGTFTPYEAIQIENGGLLIAGAYGDVDDNKDGKYQRANLTSILEVGLDGAITWRHKKYEGSTFVDVEEKGIINLAEIEYDEQEMFDLLPVFAGVVVPIYQPEIAAPPTVVATKTVSPTGPQKPGATLTYTINLANTGPGTATNVTVTDRIPEGTVYSGSTWADGFSGGVTIEWSHDGGMTYDYRQVLPVTHVRWKISLMTPGESGSLGFNVKIE